jgi:cytochrome c1
MRMKLALYTCCLMLAACSSDAPPPLGGDPEAGRLLLRQYGCVSCHRIPGVAGAVGNVGPSLAVVGKRIYLAGRVPNLPENMAQWIRDPQHFDPQTAMPDMQVSETQARHMVAYLQRLK